ncbi:MAG TPA: PA0069 family radical SAM protein [Thermoanaerobaculia bacterium]|nr:PA0069 family radical SAM protein [Thermoanaerobaculia bacterium]
MSDFSQPHKGRGSVTNPPNRFEPIHYAPDHENPPDDSAPATLFLRDPTRQIISRNDSPDVSFETSLNPYRGCEHGCVYCFARPTHEYLGFSAGLDFETKILVKENAPELLRAELSSPNWKPQALAMSGVTDPYQPIERTLQLTRRCLQVLAEFRNPVFIITKNQLVARDVDVLGELAQHRAATVYLSITTLDLEVSRKMEPRTSTPELKLAAIETLARGGVPVGVMVAPVIPGLTDHEMPAILQAAARSGATAAGYTMLRLPYAVKGIFEAWLAEHFPDRKEKVLNRVRDIRGGKLNDPRFHSRAKGEGIFAEQMKSLFEISCRRAGIAGPRPELSCDSFQRPALPQMSLFGL